MASNWNIDISILEQGSIFFFYKPKKGKKQVKEFGDVGRFYIVLKPDNNNRLRFIVMGTKKMPSTVATERGWGLVTKVGGRGFRTLREGSSVRPAGARPTGEGTYALVKHTKHTHLVYHLELPQRLGEVQKELNISRQGNYVITIKSPKVPAPQGAQLPDVPQKNASLPQSVTREFGDKRYMTVHVPSLLDHEGSTLFVIGVNAQLSKLGLSVDKKEESEATADIFNSLKLNKASHPINPLIRGTWE